MSDLPRQEARHRDIAVRALPVLRRVPFARRPAEVSELSHANRENSEDLRVGSSLIASLSYTRHDYPKQATRLTFSCWTHLDRDDTRKSVLLQCCRASTHECSNFLTPIAICFYPINARYASLWRIYLPFGKNRILRCCRASTQKCPNYHTTLEYVHNSPKRTRRT